MAAPGTAVPARSAASGRSVVRMFLTRVASPVAALIVVWAAATGAALGGVLSRPHWLAAMAPGHRRVAEAGLVAGGGLLIVIVALVVTGAFAWRLSRELTGLARAAGRLADGRLDDDRLADDKVPALAARYATMAETTAVANALASMHESAATAAAGEAGLRHGLRQVLVSLSRRNQSLAHRQLRIIDSLEQRATSSAELSSLFTLDQLTTRMRRHAESLSVLAGEAPGRSWSGPVPVLDVMRAAAAEVEDYKRVSVVSDAQEAIAAPAVTDMIHLLAELIENATLFSPSSTRVEVRAEPVGNGFVVEVEDKGLGIPPGELAEINERLAAPPDIHVADADRLGLFVAGRLAARHGIGVSLLPSAYRGTKAVVVLPAGIVVAADAVADAQTAIPQPGFGRSGSVSVSGRLGGDAAARLNLRSPEVLAMAGAATAARADAPAAAPDAPAAAPATAPATGSTPRGLPRRTARDKDRDGATGPAPRQAPPDSPAPEAARSLAASLQSSWQRSREAGVPLQAGPSISGPFPQRPNSTGPAPMAPGSEEEQ